MCQAVKGKKKNQLIKLTSELFLTPGGLMYVPKQPLIVGAQRRESVELCYFYGIWLVVWNSDCHAVC